MFSVMAESSLNHQSSEYDRLPECLKSVYSEEQYLWLSDDDKRHLVQRETEPECE